MDKRKLDVVLVGEVSNGIAEDILSVLERIEGYDTTVTIVFPDAPPLQYDVDKVRVGIQVV